MATILRDWSYRYQWFYDTISALAALSVGGDKRFRQLFLKDLPINPEAKALDLCSQSPRSLLWGRTSHPRISQTFHKCYRAGCLTDRDSTRQTECTAGKLCGSLCGKNAL